VELYGQHAELGLLCKLVARVEHPILVDVGAERGGMVDGLLRAGIVGAHALEPHPQNAAALRRRYAHDERVRVHELAASDRDGDAELRISVSPAGAPLSFGHTLLARPDTDEIAWRGTVEVARRSLGSLVEDGVLPARVGILKIDTEGHDLAVVRGMGSLSTDVVMVEHWSDLPGGLGRCPWTAAEMADALAPRGFANFAFIVHRGEFVTLKWNDGEVERGAMGNLLFIHDRALQAMLPDVLEFAGQLAERAIASAQMHVHAASERLAVIGELDEAAKARLAQIEALTAQ